MNAYTVTVYETRNRVIEINEAVSLASSHDFLNGCLVYTTFSGIDRDGQLPACMQDTCTQHISILGTDSYICMSVEIW